jgi:uncharacterized membrane protein YphA (DoxX/SURF4 family)
MCLSGIFVAGGAAVLKDPAPRVAKAAALGVPAADAATKANAVAMVLFGSTLALGIAPRASARILAMQLIPTTLAGHRFWVETDPAQIAAQRTHFLKNVGLFGGLLALARSR